MRKDTRDIEKSCEICIYALRVETTGKLLCTRSASIKKTEPEKPCRKFKLDLLSYKPKPSKLPSFVVPADSDLL